MPTATRRQAQTRAQIADVDIAGDIATGDVHFPNSAVDGGDSAIEDEDDDEDDCEQNHSNTICSCSLSNQTMPPMWMPRSHLQG